MEKLLYRYLCFAWTEYENLECPLLGKPKVPICLLESQLTPLIPAWLLTAPSFILQSLLIWAITYMDTLQEHTLPKGPLYFTVWWKRYNLLWVDRNDPRAEPWSWTISASAWSEWFLGRCLLEYLKGQSTGCVCACFIRGVCVCARCGQSLAFVIMRCPERGL